MARPALLLLAAAAALAAPAAAAPPVSASLLGPGWTLVNANGSVFVDGVTLPNYALAALQDAGAVGDPLYRCVERKEANGVMRGGAACPAPTCLFPRRRLPRGDRQTQGCDLTGAARINGGALVPRRGAFPTARMRGSARGVFCCRVSARCAARLRSTAASEDSLD